MPPYTPWVYHHPYMPPYYTLPGTPTMPGTATGARCSSVQGGGRGPWAQEEEKPMGERPRGLLASQRCDGWYAPCAQIVPALGSRNYERLDSTRVYPRLIPLGRHLCAEWSFPRHQQPRLIWWRVKSQNPPALGLWPATRHHTNHVVGGGQGGVPRVFLRKTPEESDGARRGSETGLKPP